MTMSSLVDSLQAMLRDSLPNILGGLALLVAGWFVAVVVRALIRRVLGVVKLNDRIRSGAGGKMDVEGGVAKGVYYLILLLALIAFFNALDLPLVSDHYKNWSIRCWPSSPT